MKTENYLWFLLGCAGLGLLYSGYRNVTTFAETKLVEIQCESEIKAYELAAVHLSQYDHRDRSRVSGTSGRSNAWDGEHKQGFFVLDPGFEFGHLLENMFVVRRDAPTGLVLHRIRYREGNAWVMEGDGNSGPDRNRLTPSNYAGIVVDSTVWRY
jgi:hypothetical protein